MTWLRHYLLTLNGLIRIILISSIDWLYLKARVIMAVIANQGTKLLSTDLILEMRKLKEHWFDLIETRLSTLQKVHQETEHQMDNCR